jgi:hypothetical protein
MKSVDIFMIFFCTVNNAPRYTHLQFDISANAVDIKAVQCSKYSPMYSHTLCTLYSFYYKAISVNIEL